MIMGGISHSERKDVYLNQELNATKARSLSSTRAACYPAHMGLRLALRIGLAGAYWATGVLTGCDEPETSEPTPEVAILDPSGVHYGKDYAGWAGAWTEW